jgi:hypothetical protein
MSTEAENPINNLKLQLILDWLDSTLDEAELDNDSTIGELREAIIDEYSEETE